MGERKYATAPFNFIPFPSKVLIRYPSEDCLPAHDRFYGDENGEAFLSGEITYHIKISEDSALMVGGGKEGKLFLKTDEVVERKRRPEGNWISCQDFFKNADDRFTIPGNTIRGLIRGNVQILGMCHYKNDMDDAIYLYRDWVSKDKKRRDFYKNTIGIRNKTEDESADLPAHVRAGYIYLNEKKQYVICPASPVVNKPFQKISEETLRPMAGEDSRIHYMYKEGLVDFSVSDLKDKKKLKGYRNGDYTPYTVPVSFNTDNTKGRITEICLNQKEGMQKGVLFSSGYVPGKRAHYVIGEMDEESMDGFVMESESREIRDYNKDLKRTGKDGNLFYALPGEPGKQYAKPVFYVRIDGRTYIGMTPYLRIFYPHSVWDGIPASQDEKGLDYAQAMFGFINFDRKEGEEKGKSGYRSRLRFTDAVAEKGTVCGEAVRIIPGEPKATCYPEYLVQDEEGGDLKSYIDKEFEIRGVKQYWLMNGIKSHGKPGEKINPSIYTGFRPVQRGSFRGTIYFENLTVDELGLLLYAVKISENAWQTLGMAKAFGYGKVRFEDIRVQAYDLERMYHDFYMQGCLGSPFKGKDLEIDELIINYQEYIRKKFGVEIEEEKSVQDFLYMKTHIMDWELTGYQSLEEFKDKRILPDVQTYEEKIRGQQEADEGVDTPQKETGAEKDGHDRKEK